MMTADIRKLLVGGLAIGWGAIVLATYFVVHKPFSVQELVALAQPALAVVGLGLSVVVAHGLGRLVRPWFPALEPLQLFALQVGLGLALLGLILLALGAVNGYWSWLIWLLAVAGVLFNGKAFLTNLRAIKQAWPATWAGRLLVVFIGLTLLSAFLHALTPPTAWDALVYHLTGPKLYIQAHHLHQDLDLAYLGFPQWGSMLFTWSILLVGSLLAQLMHWLFMMLTLALLPALVKPLVPGRSWLAAGFLVAVPSAVLLAGWAYVEWLTMFAGLAAFICLLHVQESQKPEGLALLAGAATGLAVAAKYNSAGLALGLGLWAIWVLRSPRLIGLFVLGGTLALGPYLLKNLILTGNPVYPFFLPGKYWDSLRAYWYGRPGTGLPFWTVLFAPWDMMAWGIEGAQLTGKVSYNATIGPLFLLLIPFAFVGWRSRLAQARRGLLGLAVVCGIAYLAWAVQLMFSGLLIQSRLLFPILPLAIVLAVAGYDGLASLNTSRFKVQFVMGALVALVLGATALGYGEDFLQKPVLPVIMGWQSQSEYLLSQLGAYEVAIEDINQLPAGSRILFLWEPRSYACADTVQCEPDVLLDRWWHLRRLGLSGTEIAAQWRAEGVGYVLIFEQGRSVVEQTGFDPLTAADWTALQALRQNDLTLVADYFGGYQLYRLR